MMNSLIKMFFVVIVFSVNKVSFSMKEDLSVDSNEKVKTEVSAEESAQLIKFVTEKKNQASGYIEHSYIIQPSGYIEVKVPFSYMTEKTPFSYMTKETPYMLIKKEELPAIAEAFQSEAAFTQSSAPKYIVATYGCTSCVAVGGYDRTNQVAFMVHFANVQEVINSGDMIFSNISRLISKPLEAPIQLHLRGQEIFSESTKELIDGIKLWMYKKADLPMVISSESDETRLFINSQTGQIGEYYPKLNPHARNYHQSFLMSALLSAYIPQIKIAYSPS